MLISESSSFKKILKLEKGFFGGSFSASALLADGLGSWQPFELQRPQPITVISAELEEL
jgi:hypothetical protein